MPSAPAMSRTARTASRRRLPRDAWLAVLVLVASFQIGVFLTGVLDARETLPVLAPIAMALAAVAAFACLVLLRAARSPLPAFAALAVVTDAAALVSRPDIPLLLWPSPALLLAGALLTIGIRGHRPRPLRWARGAALGLLGLLAVLALLVFAPGITAGGRAATGVQLGLLLIQALAAGALLLLRQRAGDDLAGWLVVSLLPAVSAGLLLLLHGADAVASSAALRAAGYALTGAGAWVGAHVYFSRASRGEAALGLAEQIRRAIDGSVDGAVMARAVSGVLCRAADLEELAVLLRTPDEKGLRVAAAHKTDRPGGEAQIEAFGDAMRREIRLRLAHGLIPAHAQRLSRTLVVLPLAAREHELGLALAGRKPHEGFPETDIALLEVALGQLALGLANAQLLWESQARLNRAEALRSLAVETSGDVDLATLTRLLVRHATRLTGAQHGELYLRTDEDRWVRYTESGADDAAEEPGDGLCKSVLSTGRVQVRAEKGTSIGAPLITKGEVAGILAVHTAMPRNRITEEDEVTLMALADQSVIALERTRLHERMARTQAEIAALYEMSSDVSSVLTLGEGVQRVAHRTAEVLRCGMTAILLCGPDGAYRTSASFGARAPGLRAGGEVPLPGWPLPPEVLTASDVAADGRLGPLRDRLRAEEVTAVLAVPLRANGQERGLLLVGSREPRRWTAEEVFLAERIGHQTAIALENGRLLGAEQGTVAKLRQLDAIKSNVIRSASHELRTPLIGIKGYTELLLETAQDALRPKQLRQLRTVAQQTDAVLAIVENVVAISALDDGNLRLEPVDMDARELVEEAATAMAPAAEAKRIEINLDIPGRFPPVRADRAAISRVLRNLLDNAVKFTPEGGQVRVGLALRGGRARFVVSDTGAGVPAGDRPRLFEKFHRGATTVDDAVPGVGLGLAISKGIVEAHGGRIGLDPDASQGAAFWFELPVASTEYRVPSTE